MKNHAEGHILGNPRAESDQTMLHKAFIKTADYSALLNTRDFNFVVGRRGTGKSAIFLKLSRDFSGDRRFFLFKESQKEYNAVNLTGQLIKLGEDYALLRAITRQLWRLNVLFSVLRSLLGFYKIEKTQDFSFLKEYAGEFHKEFNAQGSERISVMLNTIMNKSEDSHSVPGSLTSYYGVETLEESVKKALSDINRTALILYDGLDEGWRPSPHAIANLGGLAVAATDFSDNRSGIYVYCFVRDNMFRALAHVDNDYSRHVEGNSLRLQWDESGLLQLVAARLKEAFNLSGVESDVKVWNRFAHRDLKNMAGFRKCLKLTLYRPRDILVLLNRAFADAKRAGRSEIIGEDIEKTASEISHDRYMDLLKEYKVVMPGLEMFTEIFSGCASIIKADDVRNMLDEAIESADYSKEGASDFAIFNTSEQIFDALFSVGFLGVEDKFHTRYVFCHDGSTGQSPTIGNTDNVMVHPCYWKRLGMEAGENVEEPIMQVHDEYKPVGIDGLKDSRTKLIGQIIGELPSLEMGKADAAKYEEWVARAFKILFSGKLNNIELKPNGDAIQRRDIVATIVAHDGFWSRIKQRFRSDQLIVEVKNYPELKREDFRQALSYTNDIYGNFCVIVCRSSNEGLGKTERGWLQELYHNRKVVAFVLSDEILSRCMSKMRTKRKHDYTEHLLSKRLDTFLRNYLSLRHEK
ncbi:MAG: hypothetical protein KKB57_00110 [Proteobacteria bacterium]|nr:hypothetical protein [Pseudomonadota bacterium]